MSEQRSGATGLGALFAPRGVAVIGASTSPGKLGSVMARSLQGYGGALALVNSRSPDPAAGLHPSVVAAAEATSAPIDLAVLCVPASGCPAALEDAAAGGVTAALVCAGGFAEAGGPGIAHQEALLDAARRTGIRLLGPNTSGFLAPGRGLTASFVPAAGEVSAGDVAVVAASGGVNHALSFMLTEAGLGVSLAVGLGNACDVTAADVLDHLATDAATKVVALHVESVADGRRLMAAVSRLTERVPVVALVIGRNDVAEFAQSHTGALATSWRTTTAALRQAGAVPVDDEHQLVHAVNALSHDRLDPHHDAGIGLVTAQAGPGLMLLDALREREVAIPAFAPATTERLAELLPPMTFQGNPVDTGRPGEGFADVLETVAADPGVDALAAYALIEPDSTDLVAVAEQTRRRTGMPLLVGTGGTAQEVRAARRRLSRAGISGFGSPSGLADGVIALVDDAHGRLHERWREGSETSAPATPLGITSYDEDAAKTLLERELGVATMSRRACTTDDEAHAALDELGGPVAVKVLDAEVLHKTEVGGVRLGVASHPELQEALDAVRAARPGARVLVERMAPGGVDLVVGARRDPVFGPVVLLGLGGVLAEALDDVSVRVAPVPPEAAAAMPDDLRARRVLDGFRGGPRLDRATLGHLLSALGRLLLAHPDLDEVEINPLRLTDAGLVALDAVVTTTTTTTRES